MLRYIIGITLITIGIIIVRALSNGKVLKRYQYAFWLVIPICMVLLPFVKISLPGIDNLNYMFARTDETATYDSVKYDVIGNAFEILDTIPPQRLNAVTGIGFVLHDENSAVNDAQYPLVQHDQVQYDAINMVDEFKNSPLVQGAISECEAILKDREVIKDSVKEVAAASKSEKPIEKVAAPAKKSLLADLKEKKAIVAERSAAKAAAVKTQEVHRDER